MNSNIVEQERCSILKGDVFLTRTSETLDELGMSCVALRDYPEATFNGFTKRLRPKGKQVYPLYVAYYMRTPYFRENINSMASMTTRASLNNDILSRLPIQLPTYEKQEKIGNILYSFDRKIKLNNRINDNLLQQALCVYTDLINDSPRNGCIGDYCSIKSGFAFKSKWWQDSGVPVVKIGSINQDYLNLSSCSFVSEDKIALAKNSSVSGGDLLIAMTGATIGKFAMVPKTSDIILVNQRVGKFSLGDNPIDKIPFIYCTLKQPEIITEVINRGQGSAQSNISASDIMTIPCVIPVSENIDSFNHEISPMFEAIINNQYENTLLMNIRDVLIPKLIFGELDVSNFGI